MEDPASTRAQCRGREVLENTLLLRLIVGHLPPDSAMRLRRVNKTWNKIAIPVLKKQAPYITFESQIELLESRSSQLERLDKFRDCVRSSTDFPFTKLSIPLSPVLDGPAWTPVLRSVAPFLTHLIMRGPEAEDLAVYMNAELPEDIQLLRLKHLEVHADPDWDEEIWFLAGVIEASPNLKTLEVKNAGRMILRQLTHDRQLQLEKLTVQVFWYEAPYEDVTNLLIRHRDSLLELSICAQHVRSFVEMDTRCILPKLKTLQLKEFGRIDLDEIDGDDEEQQRVEEGVADLLPMQVLDYTKNFPSLKSLHLPSMEMRSWMDLFNYVKGVPSTSVTSLRLGPFTGREYQRKLVKYVPALFPHLTSLEVPASFKNLIELVTQLAHLKNLTLTGAGKSRVDPILSGLDFEDWHKYGRLSTQPFGVVKDFRQMMDKPPYCTWNKIRILKVICEGNEHRFPVSEAACQLVLLQMRNLKEVHFKGRQPTEAEISGAVMRQMEAKFTVFFPMDQE